MDWTQNLSSMYEKRKQLQKLILCVNVLLITPTYFIPVTMKLIYFFGKKPSNLQVQLCHYIHKEMLVKNVSTERIFH